MTIAGVCDRHARQPHEALELFKEVIDHEHEIVKDTFLAPQSAFELGMCYVDIGRYSDAKLWLRKARNEYKGEWSSCNSCVIVCRISG